MCKVSVKYMEPDGRDNDSKIDSFLVFFKMLLFKIQSTLLARHHGKIYYLLLIIIFGH